MNYRDKLCDPRWQKLRLEVMNRDGWRCLHVGCAARQNPRVMLVVHHRRYVAGREPWDYPPEDLVTLCENCHEIIHQNDAQDIQTDFVENRFYRWREIGSLVGHTPYGFLTQVGQRIVCGCFRLDYNPDAPHIILPGASNGDWVAKARLFVAQQSAVPIFTKEAGLPWGFVGRFHAESMTQNPTEIATHRHKLSDVGAVLFLKKS